MEIKNCCHCQIIPDPLKYEKWEQQWQGLRLLPDTRIQPQWRSGAVEESHNLKQLTTKHGDQEIVFKT